METNDADGNSIRFLEKKVRGDPEDFSANNKLGALYLQKLRETGNVSYLDLAFRTAHVSLGSVPEIRNAGGLGILAQSELAAHGFTNARDISLRLIKIEPAKSYPQGILGDAYLELGDYDNAEMSYKKMTLLDNGMSLGSETRFARLSQLKGDNVGAQRHFTNALVFALSFATSPRETVAWLRWQLGEIAFTSGDYAAAENHYNDALTTFPDYHRAVASLAHVLAARGDMQDAIAHYEKAIRLLPDPNYVAALGDLYELVGRHEDAQNQYELVEHIGHLNELNGALYNRQLALFYADHDLKTDDAYSLATKEYEVRKDVYGADAVAWTALKSGKIAESQSAMKEALKLGTKDARFYYHAGIVENAAGNRSEAKRLLALALKTNPVFDPLQSQVAVSTLEGLK